jgi:hypothetical protein
MVRTELFEAQYTPFPIENRIGPGSMKASKDLRLKSAGSARMFRRCSYGRRRL